MSDAMDIDVVELVGEFDVGAAAGLARELDESIDRGRALVVDLGDCTFVDVQILRVFRESYRRAREGDAPFFVVLPFSAAPELRFAILHLAAELVPYPVVPDRAAAVVSLSRTSRQRVSGLRESGRLAELRARAWEHGRRRERLLAHRDALILAQREALQRRESRRSSRAG